jgi:hypothetical protein
VFSRYIFMCVLTIWFICGQIQQISEMTFFIFAW